MSTTQSTHNTIRVRRTANCWMAEFSGPVAREIQALFGVTAIPTAFTSVAHINTVIGSLCQQWPECSVVAAH
jgi:hypothetical protein